MAHPPAPASASETPPTNATPPAFPPDAGGDSLVPKDAKWRIGPIEREGEPSQSPSPGSLGADEIRKVVRAGIGAVKACYTEGLARDPALAGRVTLQFLIMGDGTVTKSVIQASDLPASAQSVVDCIAAVPVTWRFPPPRGGGTVIVSYPFVLTPDDASPPSSAR